MSWERAGLCLLEEHKTPITYCGSLAPPQGYIVGATAGEGGWPAELPPSSTGAAVTQLFRVTTKVGWAPSSVPLGVHAPMSDPPSPPEFRIHCFSKLALGWTVCLSSLSLAVACPCFPRKPHKSFIFSLYYNSEHTWGFALSHRHSVYGAELEPRPSAPKAEVVLCCTPRLCTLLLKRVFSHEWGKLGTQSCFQVLYISQSGKSRQVLSTRPDFQAHRDAQTLRQA